MTHTLAQTESRHRIALAMRRIGHTYAEIALRFGVTPSRAAQLVKRAKEMATPPRYEEATHEG